MRLLLVEDSEPLALALTEVLEHAGHSVHLEGTMRGAMDALYAQEFDCVIADGRFPSHHAWQPPQDWGLDLLRMARNRKVPGILHSADEGLVNEARKQGFAAVLKTGDMKELLAAVEGA